MNKGEIITDIRARLNETSASYWTDAQLLVWVNQRYRKLVTAVETTFEDYFMIEATADTVEDQQEYALPSDFKRMRRVEINYDIDNNADNFQRAVPITLDDVRQRLGNDTLGVAVLRNPVYYIQGDILGFLPIPDADGDEAMKIWYIGRPSNMSSDSDEPVIPDEYHHLIAYGACADALRKGAREVTLARDYEALFLGGRDEMLMELEDRRADDVRLITDISGEGLDFSPGM